MNAYTPGTWSVEQGTNDFDIVVSVEGRADRRLAGYIEREADADLMAAAPELLEALKQSKRHMTHSAMCARTIERGDWGCSCGFNSAYDAACLIILKAEGR